MILKGVLLTIVFIITLIFLSLFFGYIYDLMDKNLDDINNTIASSINIDVGDKTVPNTVMNVLANVSWIFIIASLGILLSYSLHTRKR